MTAAGSSKDRRLANPYDLSTWTRGNPSSAQPASARPASAEHTWSEPASGGRAPADPRRGPTRRSLEDAPRPDPEAAQEPGPDRAAEAEIAYDPLELPATSDPFELARRTVNRSRAAARDRGLFPISAKTQARDVRDRSGRAPGYSGARPDPRDPQNIELVLRKVLGDLGWTAGISAGQVLEDWDEIVGERIAMHCRPVSFEDGVLIVSASSSAWAAQLRMLTPQLITTIEEHVGSHVVSELKVTGPAAAERTWKKGRRTVTWRGPRDTYG